MTPTTVPAAAVELVAGFEGFRTSAYPDPGTGDDPWTIGYGSTKDAMGQPFEDGDTITTGAARKLLERDLAGAAVTLARECHTALSEPCRAALVSFIYNLGATNFHTSTLLKLLNAGKLLDAANEFPKWNRAAGRVLPGLVVRRAAERKVFLSGIPA